MGVMPLAGALLYIPCLRGGILVVEAFEGFWRIGGSERS